MTQTLITKTYASFTRTAYILSTKRQEDYCVIFSDNCTLPRKRRECFQKYYQLTGWIVNANNIEGDFIWGYTFLCYYCSCHKKIIKSFRKGKRVIIKWNEASLIVKFIEKVNLTIQYPDIVLSMKC